MGSSSKRQTTMAKMARERRLQEKRERKAEKKEARKLAAAQGLDPDAPIDTLAHSRPFDPYAYVTVDDFAAALAQTAAWDIEVHEKRPRPPGAATAAIHVDDIVLRARRAS